MLSQLLKTLLQSLGSKMTHTKNYQEQRKICNGKKYSNEIIHQLNIDGGMTTNIQITSYNFNDYLSNNSR
jgi:hypothetical protein